MHNYKIDYIFLLYFNICQIVPPSRDFPKIMAQGHIEGLSKYAVKYICPVIQGAVFYAELFSFLYYFSLYFCQPARCTAEQKLQR